MTGCSRLYRRVARTFPHEFRATCGDGLEQLGQDVVPLVWQRQGAVGLIRLFADLAVHWPYEYLQMWMGKVKELTMTNDAFEGTWKARSEDSQWDARYPKPQQIRRRGRRPRARCRDVPGIGGWKDVDGHQ